MTDSLAFIRRAGVVTLALVTLPSSVSSDSGRWTPIAPEGGSIQILAAAPGSGVVYAVSGRGTVLRSLDGTANWSPRKTLFSPPFILGLAVDPTRPEVLYANTLQGFLKSTDGGKSWSNPLLKGVGDFKVAPSSPNLLYASRDKEILASRDGGARWTSLDFLDQPVSVLAVDPVDPRIVYAVALDGVWRSKDGGSTWVDASSGLRNALGNVLVRQLAIDPRRPEHLYAGELGGSIFESRDRGDHWSLTWEGPENVVGLETLKVEPVLGMVYAVFHDYGVYRRPADGASWQIVFQGSRLPRLDFDSRLPGRLYLGAPEDGIYLSEDFGDSWTPANHGFRELGFTAVEVDLHEPGVLFAVADPDPDFPGFDRDSSLFRSGDGGRTWTSPFGRPGGSLTVNDLAADPSRPGTWYAACLGSLLKTEDSGQTWRSVTTGLRSAEFVGTIAIAPSDPDTLYALGWGSLFPYCGGSNCPDQRVFRSTDGATRWRGSRLPGAGPGQVPLQSLAVDATEPSTVYASGPGIFRSLDGGATWRKIGRGLKNAVYQVVADPFSSPTLYAVVGLKRGTKVFKSMDRGETWAIATAGLPSGAFAIDLAADTNTPDTLYVATTQGVFVTRDGGRLWTAMNDGLGALPVLTVAVDPLQAGTVYAGRYDGLFKFSTTRSPARP